MGSSISYSGLNTYQMCGLRYEYAYLKKIFIPPAVALISGGGVAQSSEKDLQNKIDKGELLPDEAVKELARDAVVHRWKEEGVRLVGEEQESKGEERVKAETIDLTVNMATVHHKKLAPAIDPFAVEVWWEVELGSTGWTVRGRKDVVEKDYTIRDLKTTNKKPNKNSEHSNAQMTMYSMAHWAKTRIHPPLVMDYIVKGSDTPITLPTSRTETDYQRLLARLQASIRGIEAGIFIPTNPENWWCTHRFCGYSQMCPCWSGRE